MRLVHCVLADVRQRTRNGRFLAMVAGAAYVGYLVTGGTVTLTFGDGYAATRTDAWLGAVGAMTAASLVLFVGFFAVKNALAVDRRNGTGVLVATAPVSDARFLAGKFLGNAIILTGLVATVAVASILTSAAAGRGVPDPVAIGRPFLLVAVPTVIIVAAAALLFETVRVLSGTLGNVVYFFAAVTTLSLISLAATATLGLPPTLGLVDPVGFGVVGPSMHQDLLAAYPNYAGSGASFGITNVDDTRRFPWSGLVVTPRLLAARFTMIVAVLPLLGAAVVAFDRFDPAAGADSWLASARRRLGREPGDSSVSAIRDSSVSDIRDSSASDTRNSSRDDTGDETSHVPPTGVDLLGEASLPAASNRGWWRAFATLLGAEFRLAVRGRAFWWYAGGAVLVLAGGLLDPATARTAVLPVAIAWSLPVLSSLGVKERRYGMAPLILSSPHPVGQLVTAWLASVVVAAAPVAGVGLRLVAAGQLAALGAVVVGVVFVTSLALAAGITSGTTRLFEFGFLLLWYVGPLNGTPALDFVGVTDASLTTGVPGRFLLASGVLLTVALAIRSHRTQR